MENQVEFGNYWRNELGTEFRKKALEYVGGYAETLGKLNVDQENKVYDAELDINDEMSTIFPLGVSCNLTNRQTCFVARIECKGRLGLGKWHKYDRRIQEHITLIDQLGNEIDNSLICIDSILYLLDFLDTLNNKK